MFRGKGDYYRLGHGTDEHVRKPRLVDALKFKRVTQVAVGSLHCIVCTDEGDVFTWGDNDEGQVRGFFGWENPGMIFFSIFFFSVIS